MTTLPDATRFYIDGRWVAPHGSRGADVIDPASGRALGRVGAGLEARNDDIAAEMGAPRGLGHRPG